MAVPKLPAPITPTVNFEDPEFMDDSCHIPSWSLCVDVGIDALEIEGIFYYAPEKDFEDEPRPNTGCTLVDIGADESIYCPHFSAIPDPKKDWTIISIRAHPNPFTTLTTLSFRLFKPENVHFTVYNVQSQIVYTIEEWRESGEQQMRWNAEGLPAGMYYYRIQAGEKVGGEKVVLMR